MQGRLALGTPGWGHGKVGPSHLDRWAELCQGMGVSPAHPVGIPSLVPVLWQVLVAVLTGR